MLTKDDIEQIRKVLQEETPKIVRGIVREEVENEAQSIKDDLGSDITMSRMRIQESIDELKNRIKNLEIRVTKMHKELKEEIKIVSHVLDKENMKTSTRVTKIEKHVGISAST